MKFLTGLFVTLGALIIASITIALVAFLAGTIVWLLWPFTFPVIFPKAVASGILIAKLPWWSAVCITWIFGIFNIRNTDTSKSKSK